MPQLSIYLDEKTLRDIETAAKIEQISISKYVVQRIKDSLRHEWPQNYENLFGTIEDDTFTTTDRHSFENDMKREML